MSGMSELREPGGLKDRAGHWTAHVDAGRSFSQSNESEGAPEQEAAPEGPVRTADLIAPQWLASGWTGWIRALPSARDRRSSLPREILEESGSAVLQDLRIDGSGSRNTLIAVSPAGVFVIDARNSKGLVHTKRLGPISDLGPSQLHVGRKNCTPSVDRLARKLEAVREALRPTPWASEVPVCAVLCLTRAVWGFASPIEIDDVWIGWPKLLPARLQAPVVMDSATIQEVSSMITERLPQP